MRHRKTGAIFEIMYCGDPKAFYALMMRELTALEPAHPFGH